MTPLPESLLESVAAAAVREGPRRRRVHPPAHPDRPAARRPGPDGHRPHRASRRSPRTACWPRWPPRSARASSPPTASWPPSATRCRPTSRATTTALDLPVDLRLMRAPFRRAVLETLHATCTAARPSATASWPPRAGNPRAARAVGTRVRAQPDPDRRALPPRAARARGGIGNYGGGPARKRALLELEGASAYVSSTRDRLDHDRSGGLARVRVGLDAADLVDDVHARR